MKVFYYLLLILTLFSDSSVAQSLNPGQVIDNIHNKSLLTQSFTLTNKAKSVGERKIARLSVSPGEMPGDELIANTEQQEINFTISYNYEMNTLNGTTDFNATKDKSSSALSVKSGCFFSDPSSADLRSINFMQLHLSMGNHNVPVTISNLKLNGMDITGSYTTNTAGDIYWFIVYKNFGEDFTITGTINTEVNISNVDIIDKVKFDFGSSANLAVFPLSVYWGEVYADKNNNGNLINWNTNKEENNDRFIIERGPDGIHFTGIGYLNGARNRTLPSYYNFTDTSYRKGANYYRIKQVDMEGHASYSVVKLVNNKTAAIQKPQSTLSLQNFKQVTQSIVSSAKTNDHATKKL